MVDIMRAAGRIAMGGGDRAVYGTQAWKLALATAAVWVATIMVEVMSWTTL